jgi:hypothetical protein
VNSDALPFKGDQANEIEEECLSCSILTDDEAHCRPCICDAINVTDKCADFLRAAHLDMLKAYSRNDASR